jgi:hypothetical protein
MEKCRVPSERYHHLRRSTCKGANLKHIRLGSLFGLAASLCISACSGSPPISNNGTAATVVYMLGDDPDGGLPDTVVGYQIGSAASTSPVSTLQLPSQYVGWLLTTGPSHELYVVVSNASGSGPQVLVFAAGASGAAVPTRVIDLAYNPQSLFVDTNGKLYLASSGPAQNILVSVYGPDATGQAVPVRTLQSPTNEQPIDITVDPSGYIYLAGMPNSDSGNLPYSFIDVYPPDAEGYVEPIRSISFAVFINGIAVDSSGYVFASVESSLATGTSQPTSVSVQQYSPAAHGYATPTRVVTLPQQAAGPTAGGLIGTGGGPVRFDGAGNIFTPGAKGSDGSFNYVLYKIAPGSTNPTAVVQSDPLSVSGGFTLN